VEVAHPLEETESVVAVIEEDVVVVVETVEDEVGLEGATGAVVVVVTVEEVETVEDEVGLVDVEEAEVGLVDPGPKLPSTLWSLTGLKEFLSLVEPTRICLQLIISHRESPFMEKSELKSKTMERRRNTDNGILSGPS
jgi:hypothetical protein